MGVIDPIQNQIISDLAHDLVAQTAPQELPLFRATSEAYLKRREKPAQHKAGTEDMLGFSAEAAATFLTPAALVVASQVVSFLAGGIKRSLEKETSDLVSEFVKKMLKKTRSTVSTPNMDAPPRLTNAQAVQVHKLAFETARQLNLSEGQARLLADAVVASLVVDSS